jgi:hypothetical protein
MSRNKRFFSVSNTTCFTSYINLWLSTWLSLLLTPSLGKLNNSSDLDDGDRKFLRKVDKLVLDYTVSDYRRVFLLHWQCRDNLKLNFITSIMHANIIKYFTRKIKPKGLVCSSLSGLFIFCGSCFRSWPQILCNFICQQNTTTRPQAAEGEDDFQTSKVAVNILGKQSCTADMLCSFSLGVR